MKHQMTTQQEKLLVATLAGLIIVCAAAFAVTPATAAEGYDVHRPAEVTGLAWWDRLDARKAPAWYSARTGSLEASASVFVERCVPVQRASHWCRIAGAGPRGWVNAAYLTLDRPMPR